MKVDKDVFVWTEAFNCGEILNPMLDSYIKHNYYSINVFGTSDDLDEIGIKSEMIVMHNLREKKFFKSTEDKILLGYKKGHKGTAILWEHIIRSRSEKILIHLDSDTLFLADVISDLVKAINYEGFAIAGSRRSYKNRGYRNKGLDGLLLDLRPDVVNTDCFAFTTKYISKRPRFWLRRKILGKRISFKPVVDFFDPISFEIIKKGGTVKYMDSPQNGQSSIINYKSKFMESRISFAAVGSGVNFFKNGSKGIPSGYSGYALASYSLFAKELLDKDIGIKPLEDPILVGRLKALDKKNFKISS